MGRARPSSFARTCGRTPAGRSMPTPCWRTSSGSKDKATGGGLFSRLEDFTAADKLDARTVRFRFARPRPDFLAMVSRWGMVDPAAFATAKQKGGGTGPVQARRVGARRPPDVRPERQLLAARAAAYLDRVVFRVLSDAGAMENAFRAGQIDVAHTIPNKDAQRLRAEGLQVQPAPSPTSTTSSSSTRGSRRSTICRSGRRCGTSSTARPSRRRSSAASARRRCRWPHRGRQPTTRSWTRSSPSTPRRPGSSSRKRGSPGRSTKVGGTRVDQHPGEPRRSRRSSRETSRRWAST